MTCLEKNAPRVSGCFLPSGLVSSERSGTFAPAQADGTL